MEEDRKNQKDCNHALEQLVLLMESPDFSPADFEIWVTRYPVCNEELRAQFLLWTEMSTLHLPEPSENMRAKFYEGLSLFNQENKRADFSPGEIFRKINLWFESLLPSVRWAMVSAIFLLGIVLGKFVIPGPDVQQSFQHQIAVNNDEPEIMAAMYNIKKSTAERLKSVQASREVNNPDEKVLHALNQALLSDPNINVRLSAIESLVHFADHPVVREYLIKAIPQQKEPLIQIALADAMLLLHESRSQDALQQLLNSSDVETEVKIYVKNSLKTL
ncbi:MAG: HEAT repeat domain-containing protein [Saprospiraceae bacterium]|nr:HEAT repeat domain-containing protein [Saprospiraceae bacterium]